MTCSTQPNVALNGSVAGTTTGQWSTTGTGNFTPSNTALNATYVPGPADFIIGDIALVLTTTNNRLSAGARHPIVSYHLPPTVNAGQDVLLCDGIEPCSSRPTPSTMTASSGSPRAPAASARTPSPIRCTAPVRPTA